MKISGKNKYLLYLDILGFSEYVKKQGTEAIYNIVKELLSYIKIWTEANTNFEVIYFSDSFIFYQKEAQFIDTAFIDIIGIAQDIFIFFLSREIPVRGAITFGEFFVEQNDDSKHQIYYGKALVEAHKAEQRENWIGITIEKSAISPVTKEIYYDFLNNSLLKSNSQHYLLKPFHHINGYKWHDIDIYEDLENEVKAIQYIENKVKSFTNKFDYTSRVASKYFNTNQFFYSIINEYDLSEVLKINFDLLDQNC